MTIFLLVVIGLLLGVIGLGIHFVESVGGPVINVLTRGFSGEYKPSRIPWVCYLAGLAVIAWAIWLGVR